jgi:hypothetical protein
MAAVDKCHQQIVRALEKDGWTVAAQSPRFVVDSRLIIIDIQAERKSNGLKVPLMFVEVKCLSDRSAATTAIYVALGQYIVYRALLQELNELSPLYLAVPKAEFEEIGDVSIMRAVLDNSVRMVIVDLDEERIERWID